MTADRAALLDSFRRTFGRPAQLVAEAPGRVNLIGEHTDYNEGHVLPLAIDRTVAVAGARREGDVRACALDCGEEDRFPPDVVAPAPGGGWRNYVRGVVWALGEAGHRLPGLDLAFTGDVPAGAGLSSSAALEVALAAAFAAVAELSLGRRELALLAQRAENGFVGVQCGIMDQLAAVFGQEGHALLIDCRSLQIEPLPLALERSGAAIVIVDSAVRRSLGDSAYNERRRECAEAAAALGVTALRDVTAEALEARRADLPETLYRRARHVVTEEARVVAAAGALRGGDLEALGRLLYQSHESLRDDFEVSCPETDLLVELAAGVEGVLGARLTGAGFGGCTVNLVRRGARGAFEQGVVQTYRERSGLPARMHLVHAAGGLRVSDA
ncbi:MAG: galactokinase [Dehalococcoidia bacterium]|nr:galactokinase [Dehalococcoidia bacterium]